jgi:hypothetical protein
MLRRSFDDLAGFARPPYSMQESTEIEESARLVAGPIVCPICWDHSLEKIDGIHLSARTVTEHDISRVFLYRCSNWHMFALFHPDAVNTDLGGGHITPK